MPMAWRKIYQRASLTNRGKDRFGLSDQWTASLNIEIGFSILNYVT